MADHQFEVEPTEFVAFGIGVHSRYGHCYEIIEMLLFCKNIEKNGLSIYVEKLFYDSKSSVCSIKLTEEITEESVVEIWGVAEETITQFQIGSDIGHHKDFSGDI